MRIRTCDDCACGVTNDDWTHLDYHYCDRADADHMMARIHSMMELYGWLTHLEESEDGGFFDCDLCWETQCGGGYLFQAERGDA